MKDKLVPIDKESLYGRLVFKKKGEGKGGLMLSVQQPLKGLSVWKMEIETGEVTPATVEKSGQDTKAKNVGIVSVDNKYLYVQSLNLKNAIKKFTPR